MNLCRPSAQIGLGAYIWIDKPYKTNEILSLPTTARSISCVTDIRDKNEFEGEIVKTHKYWAVGALACIFRSKVQLRKVKK